MFPNTNLCINDPHCELLRNKDNVLIDYRNVIRAVDYCCTNKIIPTIVFPDINSSIRYKDVFAQLYRTTLKALGVKDKDWYNWFIISKARDEKTGQIIKSEIDSYSVISNVTNLSNFILIDDICDYGGTFIKARETIETKCDKLGISHDKNEKWKLCVSHNTNCSKPDSFKEKFDIL